MVPKHWKYIVIVVSLFVTIFTLSAFPNQSNVLLFVVLLILGGVLGIVYLIIFLLGSPNRCALCKNKI